jgi:hypothetical protein
MAKPDRVAADHCEVRRQLLEFQVSRARAWKTLWKAWHPLEERKMA